MLSFTAYMVSDEMQAGLESATSNLALSDIISNAMGHENSSKKDKNDLNVSTGCTFSLCNFV